MLKQFLMHQITESSCVGLGDFTLSTTRRPTASGGSASVATASARQADFLVRANQRADFFSLICDTQQSDSFLDTYAPVCHVNAFPVEHENCTE